jgi:hypothetical protein
LSTPNPDIFHAHLDKCAQCREHPFDLCKEGAGLLREAAYGLPLRQASKPFNFAPDHFGGPIRFVGDPPPSFYLHKREPHMQNIPIRTELGKEIRKAFTAEAPGTLVDADYSAVELRVLAAMTTTNGKFVCAECGCETNTSMSKPCVACGSVKVVLLALVENLFGKNWRECFKEPKE